MAWHPMVWYVSCCVWYGAELGVFSGARRLLGSDFLGPGCSTYAAGHAAMPMCWQERISWELSPGRVKKQHRILPVRTDITTMGSHRQSIGNMPIGHHTHARTHGCRVVQAAQQVCAA